MPKLVPHEVIEVSSIPSCNFCKDGTPGPYDFKTYMGPWANGCQEHWEKYRAHVSLGTGKGQLWLTKDQVDPVSNLRTAEMQRLAEDLRIAVENGTMDDEEFSSKAKALGLSDEEMEAMFG